MTGFSLLDSALWFYMVLFWEGYKWLRKKMNERFGKVTGET